MLNFGPICWWCRNWNSVFLCVTIQDVFHSVLRNINRDVILFIPRCDQSRLMLYPARFSLQFPYQLYWNRCHNRRLEAGNELRYLQLGICNKQQIYVLRQNLLDRPLTRTSSESWAKIDYHFQSNIQRICSRTLSGSPTNHDGNWRSCPPVSVWPSNM